MTLNNIVWQFIGGVCLIALGIWFGINTFSDAPVYRGKLVVTGSNTFTITSGDLIDGIRIPSCRETGVTDDDINDGLEGHRISNLAGETVDASWSTRGWAASFSDFAGSMSTECIHLRIRPASRVGMEGVNQFGSEFGASYFFLHLIVLVGLPAFFGFIWTFTAISHLIDYWPQREFFREERLYHERQIAAQRKRKEAFEARIKNQDECVESLLALLLEACSGTAANSPDALTAAKRSTWLGDHLQHHVELFPPDRHGSEELQLYVVLLITIDFWRDGHEISITTGRADFLPELYREFNLNRGEEFISAELVPRISVSLKKTTLR